MFNPGNLQMLTNLLIFQGGRGGRGHAEAPNVNDELSFPSLG
jgi:hypothetical protein